MQLTESNRKMLDFMSGTGGRLVRGTFGVLAIISAATMGGWYWMLAPLGLFMIATGIMNYCPATFLFPQYKGEKLSDKFDSYDISKN
ncbi:MAG: DUF2892 domain-containing protein [Aquiluna sp.]|jgi:predicted phage tail protein